MSVRALLRHSTASVALVQRQTLLTVPLARRCWESPNGWAPAGSAVLRPTTFTGRLPPQAVRCIGTEVSASEKVEESVYIPLSHAEQIKALDLKQHHKPIGVFDWAALGLVKYLRFFADTFFAKRYGNRAIVLETVAAIPGMVAGVQLHLKALRRMEPERGWIQAMLLEAENERMHLMTFIHLARPTFIERMLVLSVQMLLWQAYFLGYMISPRFCHRFVGYLEEEAVKSYTQYLEQIDRGEVPNEPAPQIAKDYWQLPDDARLRDVIIAVRADEANHRDVNHGMSNLLKGDKKAYHLPVSRVGGVPL